MSITAIIASCVLQSHRLVTETEKINADRTLLSKQSYLNAKNAENSI